jgi:hypothetical protein
MKVKIWEVMFGRFYSISVKANNAKQAIAKAIQLRKKVHSTYKNQIQYITQVRLLAQED